MEYVRPLGTLIFGGAYGVLPPGNSYLEEGGIRFLRATELGEGNQIDWGSCLRAPNEFARHERARVREGDVLLAVKGATIASEKSVCLVTQLTEPTIVNGSIFRFQPGHETSSAFLLEVLSSPFMRKQMKGALILNNAVDYLSRTIIDDLLFPLPPLPVQRDLVGEMERARASRRRKLEQADALLSGLDAFLLDRLGLTLPKEQDNKSFAVQRGDLVGHRIDAPAYRPFFEKGHLPKTRLKPLLSLAEIDPPTGEKPSDETSLVPYVGLPECDLTEIREVAMRPYFEVKGRSAFQPGDILFARIEPSVFNKKYVLADDLKGHDFAFTSTEFYVVRPQEGTNRYFLYSMFFCSFVFAQVRGKTTGSSGRRRIDPELFGSLMVPAPDKTTQDEIAGEVRRRRLEARRLREEAAREWEAAKARFEARLLSGEPTR
jgi:type I restriction enzyme S subunit